jgi:hypothetical protein
VPGARRADFDAFAALNVTARNGADGVPSIISSDRPILIKTRGSGREVDRTSIEAQVIPMLCKCLRAVRSVARHAACLGQAEPLANEVFM